MAANIIGLLLIVLGGFILVRVSWTQEAGRKDDERLHKRKYQRAISAVFVSALFVFALVQTVLHWVNAAKLPLTQPLYYGDEKLNGRTITLERGCHPSACVTMHVWPWPNPDSFGLYGIWTPRPSIQVSPFTNARLFLEFSEEVSLRSGSSGCSRNPEKPHTGYKASLIRSGGPTIGEARWTLPFFNFMPIPSGPLHIRVKFEYGDIQSDAAGFTLRPPP